MMSLAVVRALLARVPSIAWIVIGSIVLIIAGYAWAIRRGQLLEHRRVVAAAHRDTTQHAIVVVDSATSRSDSAIARAGRAKTKADTGRAAVRAELARVKSLLDSTPAPVVQLVQDQSTQITRDSITQAVQLAAIDSLRRERLARQQLDTARVHEREDPSLEARGTPVLAIGVGSSSGAAIGAMVGGPVGAAVGAGVGAVVGWLVGR